MLIPFSNTDPEISRQLREKVVAPLQQNERAAVWYAVYTDGNHLYGSAAAPHKHVLWRLDVDSKVLSNLSTVDLPNCAIIDMTIRDLIEDTINEGAWD
jgi:hypothetical protein